MTLAVPCRFGCARLRATSQRVIRSRASAGLPVSGRRRPHEKTPRGHVSPDKVGPERPPSGRIRDRLRGATGVAHAPYHPPRGFRDRHSGSGRRGPGAGQGGAPRPCASCLTSACPGPPPIGARRPPLASAPAQRSARSTSGVEPRHSRRRAALRRRRLPSESFRGHQVLVTAELSGPSAA